MDQYQIIDNLMDLYSQDEELRLEALLAKKEWILDRFYVPYSIMPSSEGEYSDLQALKKLSLPFHRMVCTGVTTTSKVNLAERFNTRFRRLRLYEHLPERPQRHIFFAEVNFRKIDKEDYKILLPYFFYCLTPAVLEEIELPNDIRRVVASAIEGRDDEAVQIVDVKYLDKNTFKVDGFSKIYVYDDLNPEEISSIRDIAKYLHLPVVNVHVGSK